MTTLPDTVARDPQRTIAELRRQLDERTAERDEALEQQTATAEVLQVINSARGDLAPVFDAIVEKATRLCGASSGALYIRDGDLVRIAAMRDAPAALAEFVSREPVRLTDMLGRGSLPPAFIHVADMSVGEAYRRRVPIAVACVELGGIRTLLAVPLLKDGCVVGVFIIYRQEVRPFSDRQIALLQSFAVQAVIAMENARLLGELRQRTADLQESLEFQTATSDVLKVISGSAFELAPVLETVVNTAARLCRADQAVIYRLQDGEYQWAAGNSLVAEYERIERNNKIRPSMGTLVGRAALSRSTVHILDAWTDPLYEAKDDARLANLHTMLGVPLLREGVPIGVIGLGRVRVEPYSEKEIELVCSFADQAVIAMENARLLGELRQSTADLQESLRYQTATGDVLKVISRSTFDLQPVLDTLVETAVQLCEADSAMISSREGEVFRVRATSSFSPEFAAFMRGRLLPAGRGSVSGRAGIEGQVVHAHDVASDPEYALPETLTLDKARTLLGVPLLREGVVVGVIALSRHRMQPFSERQIELVRSFADQAVIAMENARLLDEIRTARDTAEVALERQTATSDILKVIAGSPSDTRPVFDAIAARANRLLGGFSTAVWRFEGDKGYLAAFTPTNPEADAALQAMSPLAITDLVFVQLSNGQIAQLPDTEEGPPRLRDIARLRGYRAMLFVPLMAQGAPIGFVSVTRKEVGSFNLDDVQLLQTFADQGVIAIQNAQLFNELTRRTGELEEALEQQTATAEILRAISQSPTDVQPVLDVVAGAARRFCGANDVIIMLRDDGELVIAAHEGPLVARRGRLVLARDSTAGRAVIDGQTCHLPDIEALDPVEFAMARNLAAQRGFRATVAAPLMREGSAVGAVLLRKAEAGPFTPQQIALLETFAAQAVIAIENVRLFTELKESLERLKAAQANLIQSEKMASLGQLTAGIAHEIKNPLNFVNNFAGLSVELLGELKEIAAPVLAGMDEGARADFGETMELITGNLDKIAEHGRRADGIVKSMLSHSRGGTGDRRSADVNGLLEESLNLAFHGARAQDQNFNITLERDFDPSLGAIELVPQDITRVFLNLCGNGFYAANKRRRDAGQAEYRPVLKVATRELGHAVEVRIRDNGIGIPPEVRGKLFQPFFTTKPTGEGTGLGLSISYDIVTQQHGGTIDVESEVGDFTEFIIRLPRRRPAAKIGAA